MRPMDDMMTKTPQFIASQLPDNLNILLETKLLLWLKHISMLNTSSNKFDTKNERSVNYIQI